MSMFELFSEMQGRFINFIVGQLLKRANLPDLTSPPRNY
jgi:hypothetical protein